MTNIVEVTVVAPNDQPGALTATVTQSFVGIEAVLPDQLINDLVSSDQELTIGVVLPEEPVPPALILAFVPVPGPPGPPGPSGTGGDKNYLHVQNAPSDTWVINHDLEKYPSIEVFDSAGTQVYGAINYIDINTAIVTFSVLFGGTASCN